MNSFLRQLFQQGRQCLPSALFLQVIGIIGLVLALMVGGGQHALTQCLTTGLNEVTCSGDSDGYTVVGSTVNDTFNFANGVTGQITIVSGGQTTFDTISFSGFLTGVAIDLSNQAGYQTVAAGLQIWFQNFTVAQVNGSTANDTITGTAGNDTINGGAGADDINGAGGDDTLNGGADNDYLNGGAGTNVMSGDAGNDFLLNGGTGADTMNGGADDDTLVGGDFNDTLNGDAGNDIIFGGAGIDTINGGTGADELHGGADNDAIDGAGGTDTFVEIIGTGMTIDLNAGTATGSGTDTLTNIENVTVGGGNDTIIGNAADNVINTGDGNNTVDGGAGNDTIIGGDNDDNINGGAGDDIINGGGTADNDTRTDTIAANCPGDTVTNVETDNCPTTPIPTPTPSPVFSAPMTPELCITDATRVALDGGTLLVFSDFRDTPNGMTISHISLGAIPALTDEQKASGAPVPLVYKDSEFAPGWSVGLYWQNNHYGVIIYKDGGKAVYDDTGAICGWF